MPALLTEISATVPTIGRQLKFTTTEDVVRWVDAEVAFWNEINVDNVQSNLKSAWQQQSSQLMDLRNQAVEFNRRIEQQQEGEARQFNDALQARLNALANGAFITSDYEFYPAIVDVAKTSPELAALVLVAARADSAQTLGALGNYGTPFRDVIRLILQYGRSKGTRDWLQPQRKELTELRDGLQGDLDRIRASLEAQEGSIAEQRLQENQAKLDRGNEWSAQKEQIQGEWDALKRVYDEQLALLAPTQYWAERAVTHRKVAIGFAMAFGLLLAASIGIFVWLAMPHLFEVAVQKDVSPILALIPVAVPAFAGIWVLKMLSRLLSENLQMMRDAKERETMVKTFLALMRDDTAGKTLVKDDDRILILHSLFRPSSVSAIDDAPPVHWFDILTNKVSGKGKAGA